MIDRQQATRIILARHGEARYPSSSGRGDGGGTLTEVGRAQAHALGEGLQDKGVAAVFCSDLSRAQQTAGIAAELLGRPVEVQAGLREYELGDEPHDVVRRYDGRTVLAVSHGGAIIATLGAIAAGHTGLPGAGHDQLQERDIPGGASFLLEHGPDGWRLLPRMTP